MDNNYTIIVLVDGKKDWFKTFDNAVDAVNCYNKFIDYGTSLQERVVTLVEPSGKLHTKIYKPADLVRLN